MNGQRTKAHPNLGRRSTPRQERSIQRSQQILEVTAQLLERVGFDDLTTILIARELHISVGTLYHYFPNKHAIMHAIAEQWLSEYSSFLNTMENWSFNKMNIEDFCNRSTALLFDVYERQRGILPLIAAISAVPELAELDQQHDEEVATRLSSIFKRLGVEGKRGDHTRLAIVFLEMTHATLMVALEQTGIQRKRTLDNIIQMSKTLLSSRIN